MYLVDKETHESKGHGVVGFTEKEHLDNALEEKDVVVNNNNVSVFPFKQRQRFNNTNKPRKFTGNKQLYRHGYNDGVAVGYDQGYEDGYNKGYEDSKNGEDKNSKKNYLKRPFLKNVVNNAHG